jgi:hypothetical protein
MKSHLINRRTALKGGGLLGAGAIAALMPATALASQGQNEQGDATGGWDVTVTVPGRPTANVLVVLTNGGGALRSSQNDLKPASLASPSYGSWANLKEKGQIAITFRNFRYSATGDLVGTSKIRVRATLSEDGDGFAGGGNTQLIDLNGSITATINFTVDASRIAIELPE